MNQDFLIVNFQLEIIIIKNLEKRKPFKDNENKDFEKR